MNDLKKEKNKKILQVLLISGLALAGLLYFFPQEKETKPEKLVFTLDFGDSRKTYQTFIAEEKRAWSLLQQVAAVSGTNLEAGKNFAVKKIDGKENGAGDKEWSLYVNGKKETRSPYDVIIKPPASVEFKFE